MEKTLKVKGMHCKSCNMLLEDSVGEIHGVGGVKADFEKGQVRVKYGDEALLSKIKGAIEKEGYTLV